MILLVMLLELSSSTYYKLGVICPKLVTSLDPALTKS